MSALVEWLGHGGEPVDHGIAEYRASVCRGCPLNAHGKWWETSKSLIAESIRKILELKNHRQIFVSNEENLFMCGACGCALRLKVHAPIEHIRNNMPFSQAEKLDPGCWIPREISEL